MLMKLSALDLGRLRMSVGYGTHKKDRPLSPIEVGQILSRARESGVTLKDCAEASGLHGTGHIGRFLRILQLPHDLQHLVDWGADKGSIGFSAAVELVKLKNSDDQRVVAEAILTKAITSKEVRQISQLRKRSRNPIDSCIEDVIAMRPIISRRYVFIGSIVEKSVEEELLKLTQAQRNSILDSSMVQVRLHGAQGRLGTQFFTLIGDECFQSSIETIGKEKLERQLRTHIAEKVEHGRNR